MLIRLLRRCAVVTVTSGATHTQEQDRPRSACLAVQADLGAYHRAELSRILATRVAAHLQCCHDCTAIYHAGLPMFD